MLRADHPLECRGLPGPKAGLKGPGSHEAGVQGAATSRPTDDEYGGRGRKATCTGLPFLGRSPACLRCPQHFRGV